jgi:hypothetical protein
MARCTNATLGTLREPIATRKGLLESQLTSGRASHILAIFLEVAR